MIVCVVGSFKLIDIVDVNIVKTQSRFEHHDPSLFEFDGKQILLKFDDDPGN